MTIEDLARKAAEEFHETYERLAPQFGYATRTDTRKFDPESANGKLMIAVCGQILAERDAEIAVWKKRAEEMQQEVIIGDHKLAVAEAELKRQQESELAHVDRQDAEIVRLMKLLAVAEEALEFVDENHHEGQGEFDDKVVSALATIRATP